MSEELGVPPDGSFGYGRHIRPTGLREIRISRRGNLIGRGRQRRMGIEVDEFCAHNGTPIKEEDLIDTLKFMIEIFKMDIHSTQESGSQI